ncbi:MAG: peroxiredoxin, partial [Candidatus Omnitrophica bacterium]|nr:peroxiredoxin [Candidatus Omnitrophota bacterium]
MATPQEGKKAPAFSLPSSTGKKISLKDLAGKKVVLYFYPKDNTPGCTTEACAFRDAHKDFEKSDTVILGVSPDGLASHEKFINKYDLPFVLLADEDHA